MIGSDGRVYATSDDGWLHATEADGTGAWSYELDDQGETWSSPTVGADGTVYVTAASRLFAIDASGSLAWRALLGIAFSAAPTVADDGTLYVGGADHLHAFESGSAGLADSAWPTVGRNERHTGRTD